MRPQPHILLIETLLPFPVESHLEVQWMIYGPLTSLCFLGCAEWSSGQKSPETRIKNSCLLDLCARIHAHTHRHGTQSLL